MIPTLLYTKLIQIKQDLEVIAKDNVQQEQQYITSTLEYLQLILESSGIYKSLPSSVQPLSTVEEAHFKELIDKLVLFFTDISTIEDDVTMQMNMVLGKVNDIINTVTTIIDSDKTKTNDLVKKSLSAVSMKSIYNEEIVDINFNMPGILTYSNITTTNILTLPHISSKDITFNANSLGVTLLDRDIQQLNLDVDNTINIPEYNIQDGYWISRFIGLNIDKIHGEQVSDMNNMLNLFNDEFVIQTIIHDITGSLTIAINGNIDNFVNVIDINANASLSLIADDIIYKLKHNMLHTILDTTSISLILDDIKSQYITHKVVYVAPITSTNVVKYEPLNLYESAIYNANDVDIELQPIKHKLIEQYGTTDDTNARYNITTKYERVKLYNTVVKHLTMKQVTYGQDGYWKSNFISTDKEIVAIELTEDVLLQDETNEISYQLSFDNKNWFDIRPVNSTHGDTDMPIRIEINTNSLDPKYKVVTIPQKVYGYYLQITMHSNNKYTSPVIYSIKTRIKTEVEQ